MKNLSLLLLMLLSFFGFAQKTLNAGWSFSQARKGTGSGFGIKALINYLIQSDYKGTEFKK
ncbi:MAG TPA: hypothetical protein GXX42_02600 [Petrimonas sp.]|uniref:hypothetical protein n=1 Tax=Petrimonas sp. TaxID=2023866 RepID=UPI0017715552|nr:hypothetical protein [Petrimonas sp.]